MSSKAPEEAKGNTRLAILLAMAMFVLVVDTSLMNVSISAVVHDLDTTVSGVQSAIALEALVSAAFILIGSKVGDLIGRKRAYVLGLLGYAVGALAMALAQSLTAIIIFWAIIGGLGASLLLPAMQSLIHGNFEGAAQKKAYALVGAAAAIAAAVGPLLGGFITTYLSWRVGVPARGRHHRDRAVRHQARPRRAVHRARGRSTSSARCSRSSAWAASCSASSCGRRAARPSARSWRSARSRWRALVCWLVRRKRAGEADADRPGPVQVEALPVRDLRADAPADRPRRHDDRAARSTCRWCSSTTRCRPACRSRRSRSACSPWRCSPAKQAGQAAPEQHHPGGLRAPDDRHGDADPDRARGRRPAGTSSIPLLIAGSGLGLLVSQLNNYTLAPISEERVSEAAGVNSAAGSFGLSFGLAFAGAIMLATLSLSFTNHGGGEHRAPAGRAAAGRARRSSTTPR